MSESEKPAFEIIAPDGSFHCRIFASGRTEGFEGIEGPRIIVNRIPLLICEAVQDALQDARVNDTPNPSAIILK